MHGEGPKWRPLRLLRGGEKLKNRREPEQVELRRQRAAVLLDAGRSLRSAAVVTGEWTAAAGGVALVAGYGATAAVAEAAAAPAGMGKAAGPLVSAPAASVLPELRKGSQLHGSVGNWDPAPGEPGPAPGRPFPDDAPGAPEAVGGLLRAGKSAAHG